MIAIARRSIWLVVAVMVGFGALGFVIAALGQKKYAADARVLLSLNDPSETLQSAGDQGTAVDPSVTNAFIQTQLGVITGRTVLEDAMTEVTGIEFKEFEKLVAVRQVGTTSLVDIVATADTPELAQRVANAVVGSYAADRKASAVAGLQLALAEVSQRLDDLRDELERLTESQADSVGDGNSNEASSSAELRAAEVQFAELFSRQQELEINLNLKRGGIEIVSAAELPEDPVAPKPLRTGLTAAFLGLLVASGAVFVRELLDTSVRTADDIKGLTKAPVLAVVREDVGASRGHRLALVGAPFSPFSEAIRGLRTSMQFLAASEAVQVLVVTSTYPSEGKTTIAANLAVAHAQTGRRTLLVSADLRRPSADELFGATADDEGLSDLTMTTHLALARGEDPRAVAAADLRRCVRDTGFDGLMLLPAGTVPPNPNELLGSEAMRVVMHEIRAAYDIVIIDCPPVAPVSDALLVASISDGLITVVGSSMVDRGHLRHVLERIDGAGLRLVGIVLNRLHSDDVRDGYGAYEAYGAVSGDVRHRSRDTRAAHADRSTNDARGAGRNGSGGVPPGTMIGSRPGSREAAGR